MKCPFAILLFIIFLSCNETDNKLCTPDTSRWKNAFAYPDHKNRSDTDIFSYPIKDYLSLQDSLVHVNYGTAYFQKFNEPNFSLRFFGIETFRFYYHTNEGYPINISFNNKEITIKTGKKGLVEQVLNYDKLDSLERKQLRFFERFTFANKENFSVERKKYYDSFTMIHPELLSTKFYRSLFNKAIDNDSLRFEYSTTIIKLTPKDYCQLIDSLDASDFWNLPWRINYPEGINDGGGYTFEAHTKNKYKLVICYGMPINTLGLTHFCQYLVNAAALHEKVNL